MPAGVLLHHLETHIGIVVLITNKPEAIDTAFQRRIRFSMTFPMPDAPLRSACPTPRPLPPPSPLPSRTHDVITLMSKIHCFMGVAAVGEAIPTVIEPELVHVAEQHQAKVQ